MIDLLSTIPDREDLEVIMVDDHSSLSFFPETSFEKTRLSIIKNDLDCRFAGTARNAGIRASNGDYLIFVDSDDMLVTEEFNGLLDEVIRGYGRELYIARPTSFKEDGTPGDRHLNANRILDRLVSDADVSHLTQHHAPWAKIISREYILSNDIRFGNTRVANDVLFSIKLAALGPTFCFLDRVVYKVRQGNQSLTSDQSLDALRTRLNVQRISHKMLDELGRPGLRAPLHYSLRPILKSFPIAGASELIKSIIRREFVCSSAHKMLKTVIVNRKAERNNVRKRI